MVRRHGKSGKRKARPGNEMRRKLPKDQAVRAERGEKGSGLGRRHDSREARPPVHELRVRQRGAVIEGRVGEEEGGAIAANDDEQVTAVVLRGWPADNDRLAAIGDSDDLVQGARVAPRGIEAEQRSGALDAHILDQAKRRRNFVDASHDLEYVGDTVVPPIGVEDFGLLPQKARPNAPRSPVCSSLAPRTTAPPVVSLPLLRQVECHHLRLSAPAPTSKPPKLPVLATWLLRSQTSLSRRKKKSFPCLQTQAGLCRIRRRY